MLRKTKEWRTVLRSREVKEEGHRIRFWHRDHTDKESVREPEHNGGYRIWFECQATGGTYSIWRKEGDDADVGPEDV